MNLQTQAFAIPPDQFLGIALGAVLLFIGVCSGAIALIRRRGEVRILVWFALFSGIYGVRLLLQVAVRMASSRQTALTLQNTIDVISYLVLVVAIMFWWELSLGKLRRFNEMVMIPAVIIAMVGIGLVAAGKPAAIIMPFNNGLAVCVVLILLVISVIPRLSSRYLAVPARVLAVGTSVFAFVALWVNLEGFLGLPNINSLEPIAFTIFVLSLGYVAAEKIFANERRLLAIESELSIAREIQRSILPVNVPELANTRVAAAYHPMTSVAGDFYEFVVVDRDHAGFLVADVSGHGVPAALIASMIKVAMQSVSADAGDPAQVLRGLNRVLSNQLRGQFVTAAYLWLDMENRRARYSAAGHPPLLCWRAAGGELKRLESNGLLFGVLPDTEYPNLDFDVSAGDRLLLYTDGIVEAENAAGDAFGDSRLEQVLRTHHALSAAELSDRMLEAQRNWQPPSVLQQDDLTLVVIDVL
jgi:sigma-B regulation protein RsbU (phosphoserine phosphatase)